MYDRIVIRRSSIRDVKDVDLVVVGSGFFGGTIAERVANELGKKVLVIEKRDHVGGNAFSYLDSSSGIEIHKYGSHIFHTSNLDVWNYVNRFSSFNNYRHKVVALFDKKFFTIPINLATLSKFLNKPLTPSEAEEYFSEIRKKEILKDNLESKAISLVGKDLYEAFIKGYTIKQWQRDPKDLPPDIIQRIPVRSNFNDYYFDDDFEGIPLAGYGKLFEKMLQGKNIEVLLNADYFDVRDNLATDIPVVYTGPIDRYFNYIHGRLGWRSVRFEIERLNVRDYQGTSVINYPEIDYPYTRIHEFKHFHPENQVQMALDSTVIMKEFSIEPSDQIDPYYPINSRADKKILAEYRQLVKHEEENNIFFGGRLGSYQYLDMHMAIASALALFNNRLVALW